MPKSPVKRAPKEEVAIIHVCSEEDKINALADLTNKLSIIITGNGNPDTGICRRVAIITERQSEVIRSLEKIDRKTDGLLSEIADVHAKVISVKSEVLEEIENKKKIADDLITAKARDWWYRVLTMIGILIAIYFGFKNNHKADIIAEKQDDQSIPFVVGERGQILALPDSTRIIWYNNDSARYLIKRER